MGKKNAFQTALVEKTGFSCPANEGWTVTYAVLEEGLIAGSAVLPEGFYYLHELEDICDYLSSCFPEKDGFVMVKKADRYKSRKNAWTFQEERERVAEKKGDGD